MTGERALPVALPGWISMPSRRALGVAAVVVLALLIVAAGLWAWMAAQQRQGAAAYADVLARLQGPVTAPEVRAAALVDLEGVLQRYPSHPMAAQGAYELANTRFAARQFAQARAAYEVAAAKSGGDGTVQRLALAGIGYAWEAERDFGQAAQSFQRAVAPLAKGQFLYEELLVDLARVQELAGRRDDAVKTYRKVLEDPKSRRSDDVRARLATLGIAP